MSSFAISVCLGAEQSVLGIQSTVTPQFASNSDVMDGTVAVAVFLVESTGGIDPNIYTWSQADQDIARSQVIDGLNWWVEQSRAFNLARPLQFTPIFYDASHPACQIPYEPVIRPGTDAPGWVNHIMNNLGASGGNVFERVAAFEQGDKGSESRELGVFDVYRLQPVTGPGIVHRRAGFVGVHRRSARRFAFPQLWMAAFADHQS